jgi:hypothetical protein
MNPAACNVYAGTWCPNPQDCTELVNCVEDFKITSAENGTDPSQGFNEYLQSSPSVTDPTDPAQCGGLRRYYGFDPLFVNDGQICDDIEQVGLSAGSLFAGFSFAGSSGSTGDDVTLDEPDTRKYALKRRAARTLASGTFVSSMCSPRFLLLSLAWCC